MKSKFIQICLLVVFCNTANAQIGTIKTSGKHILGPCGDTLILRGINYAVYNWGWSPNENYTSEIAKTGANCIRINWYVNAGNATPTALYNDYSKLDSAILIAVRNKMIVILDLHDETCKNSPTNVVNLIQWYIKPQVKSILTKYAHSLILNLANEALYIEWSGNKTQARIDFTNTYKIAIDSIRNAGIKMPLMIDASECGTNLKELSDVANALTNYDPTHNIIYSAHTYWYAYANNDSATMAAELQYALNKNIPLVLGEIANQQDDVSNCQYNLNYKALLNICQTKKISWVVWGWYRDVCPLRQVSSTGLANNLTTYGNDIVNNPKYGLKNTAILSKYLKDGRCNNLNSISKNLISNSKIYPNPFNENFEINVESESYEYKIYNTTGQIVNDGKSINHTTQISANEIASGIYFLEITFNGIIERYKIIKN